MSLYVKLAIGFYSHRKTLRLRILIGDDAFWIPPRLWSYAAEHQPDGDFSSYKNDELAMLLGCNKHATSILDALKQVGFIDADGSIHDWETHNGYHLAYSVRGKKAAAARWKEKVTPKEKKDTDKDKDKETSIASSMLVASKVPQLSECIESGNRAGVRPEATESWYHEHDARGWLDKKGIPMVKWLPSLVSYGRNWDENRHKTKLNGNGHPRNGEAITNGDRYRLDKEKERLTDRRIELKDNQRMKSRNTPENAAELAEVEKQIADIERKLKV